MACVGHVHALPDDGCAQPQAEGGAEGGQPGHERLEAHGPAKGGQLRVLGAGGGRGEGRRGEQEGGNGIKPGGLLRSNVAPLLCAGSQRPLTGGKCVQPILAICPISQAPRHRSLPFLRMGRLAGSPAATAGQSAAGPPTPARSAGQESRVREGRMRRAERPELDSGLLQGGQDHL